MGLIKMLFIKCSGNAPLDFFVGKPIEFVLAMLEQNNLAIFEGK